MTYVSDRQAVELLIPVIALTDVVIYGATNSPDTRQCIAYLAEARKAIQEVRPGKIGPRAGRHYDQTFRRFYQEGVQVHRVGLIVYHFLKVLTDADYLVLGGPDDPLNKALALILPAMDSAIERDGDDPSAEPTAHVVIHTLQGEGLYRDLSLVGEVN